MRKYLNTKSKPKAWFIGRSVKYVTTMNPGKISDVSMPIFLVLRDLLVLGKGKDIMKILKSKAVSINNKIIKTKQTPVCLYDLITYDSKKYRFCYTNKRYNLVESSSDNIFTKVIKTTTLKHNKFQINTLHGYNFIVDTPIKKDTFATYNTLTKALSFTDYANTTKFLSIKGKHKGLVFEKDSNNTFTFDNLPVLLNINNIIGLNETV